MMFMGTILMMILLAMIVTCFVASAITGSYDALGDRIVRARQTALSLR